MQGLIERIEGSAINSFVLDSTWVWPILEILHFVGLSLLLGSLLVVDLRMAGFFRQLNVSATHKLLPWAVAGFTINLATGFLFLMGDPVRYAANIGFRLKMLLVLVAGVNTLWFWLAVTPSVKNWEAHADTPAVAKLIAWISLGTWFGVLLLGRLIPYIGTG